MNGLRQHQDSEAASLRGFLNGRPSGVKVLAGSLTGKGTGTVTIDAIIVQHSAPPTFL